MARLLLCNSTRKSSRSGSGAIGRVIALLAAVTIMPACIIPLAPDFQNPPAEVNYQPQILNPIPLLGSVVTSRKFTLTVTDPNATDTLHVRWIADFPNFGSKTRTFGTRPEIPPRPDGLPLREQLAEEVDCTLLNLDPLSQRHQIMVVVADRPFEKNAGQDLLKVEEGALPAIASWTLELQCQTTTPP